MNDAIETITKVINGQKGEIEMLSCLVVSIVRAMPLELRGQAFREFDIETESARVVLLNSGVEQDMLDSFELHVARLNALRFHSPS